MPLIEPGNAITTILYIDCMCGKRSNNYEMHYRHIPDCYLHRCQYCLTVLRGGPITDNRFDDPVSHKCPHIRINELERGING